MDSMSTFAGGVLVGLVVACGGFVGLRSVKAQPAESNDQGGAVTIAVVPSAYDKLTPETRRKLEEAGEASLVFGVSSPSSVATQKGQKKALRAAQKGAESDPKLLIEVEKGVLESLPQQDLDQLPKVRDLDTENALLRCVEQRTELRNKLRSCCQSSGRDGCDET